MNEEIIALLLLALIGWLWSGGLRARERANMLCRQACVRRGVQLLDQTVALKGLDLHWGPQGLRLRRSYRFEYSEEGTRRQTGSLVLVGLSVAALGFAPEQLTCKPDAAETTDSAEIT